MTGPTSSRLAVSVRVAAPASGLFANAGTALTSLVFTPVIGSLFLVAIAASVASPDLRLTAYAGIIVTGGSAALSSIAAMMSTDRRIGIVEEVFTRSLFSPAFWTGKLIVALLSSGTVALVSGVAVFALDPAHSIRSLLAFVVVLPAGLIVGAIVGCSISVISVTLDDPYLIANVVTVVLPLTAGVVAPLSAYPDGLAIVARFFPLTGTVEIFRATVSRDVSLTLWHAAIGGEAAVLLFWVLVAVLARSWIVARIRSGAASRMTL
jgi:ABC-2 type transport system permease protein